MMERRCCGVVCVLSILGSTPHFYIQPPPILVEGLNVAVMAGKLISLLHPASIQMGQQAGNHVINSSHNIQTLSPIPYIPKPRKLQSISEPLLALNSSTITISLLIRTPEHKTHHQRNQDHETGRQHGGNDTWSVFGSILVAEDCATDDASNAAETDECCGAESAFPLTSNIVCL